MVNFTVKVVHFIGRMEIVKTINSDPSLRSYQKVVSERAVGDALIIPRNIQIIEKRFSDIINHFINLTSCICTNLMGCYIVRIVEVVNVCVKVALFSLCVPRRGDALDGKVSNQSFNNHVNDNAIHITDVERARWNAMAPLGTLQYNPVFRLFDNQ